MKSALYRPARIAEPMSRDQIPTYDSSKTLGVQLIVDPSETSFLLTSSLYSEQRVTHRTGRSLARLMARQLASLDLDRLYKLSGSGPNTPAEKPGVAGQPGWPVWRTPRPNVV
jgi:hypothetical protein